ncbi:MAG: hypothetical protein F6K09_10380 [Merismopedia sp. SIO2A8]|nr:hypothetical protein [Merismopedia sp. SIO2A8]
MSQSFQDFEQRFTVATPLVARAMGDGKQGGRSPSSQSFQPSPPIDPAHQAQLGLICITQKTIACLLTDLLSRKYNRTIKSSIPYEI